MLVRSFTLMFSRQRGRGVCLRACALLQVQEREIQLTEMLMEARGSLVAMQKLHHASQNQLFAMQSQSEEEKVHQCVLFECMPPAAWCVLLLKVQG